jgi:NAD(P)-dependent dehydrogenase (short-subunit alcohol dehydrogenase family)
MKDHGGLVLNISSAYGFVPNLFDPMYATSKAGVAMLTRSLATIGMGIRVNALCPEYVNTPLLSNLPSSLTDFLRDRVGLVELEKVIAAAFTLLDDDSKVGECLWVPANRPTEVWPDEESKSKHQLFMKDGSICFNPFAQMS